MHPKAELRAAPIGALEALVEAENRWRAHLDATRAEAARLVAAAREEADRAAAAVERERDALVQQRRRELDARLASHLAEITRGAQADVDRYARASDEAIASLAGSIVDRMPWLAPRASAKVGR